MSSIENKSFSYYKYAIIINVCFSFLFSSFLASGGGGSMLVPPVAQGGTGDRPVGDAGGRAQQSSGPAGTATLWPLAPAQPNQVPNQQSQGIPPLAATPAPAHNQGTDHWHFSLIRLLLNSCNFQMRNRTLMSWHLGSVFFVHFFFLLISWSSCPNVMKYRLIAKLKTKKKIE